VVLPDPAKDAASLARAAEWIGHADLVYFTGGDQSRLVPRFKTPEGRDNAVMQALRDGMLKWGTVVGGTSAGAAVMADPMFTGGGSEEALGAAEPGDKDEAAGGDSERRRGPRLGLGFGLVGGVVIDTHTGARGRVGRMVAALEKSGMRWGLGLNENGAVVVRGGQWTAIGDEAAFVLDAKDLRRDATGWHGVRLGVLSDGDRVELPVNPGENVEDLPGNKAEEMALEKGPGTAPGGQSVEHEGAWKAGVLMKGLMSLSARPSASVLLRGKAFDVSLRADADTQFGVQRGSPAVRAWGVVLGIFPHVEGEKKVDGEGEGTGR
jgi:cyanophycinase